MDRYQNLFDDLRRFVGGHGVRVMLKTLDIAKPGAFDGLSITMNPSHAAEPRSYYLAHAFGSIVQWSTETQRSKTVFEEVREATARRGADPARLDAAIDLHRRFEEISSEYAIWVLHDIGHGDAVGPYTSFFRADIEAIMLFHRTGHAPRWPEFFAQWKKRSKGSDVWVKPFLPRPVPSFKPVKIDPQEIFQQRT